MEHRVIYADVLFLTELFFDLVSVIYAGMICHRKIKPFRFLTGAAAGAFISVTAEAIIHVHRLTFALGIPISFLMAFIAFGKTGLSDLLRLAALIWTSGCLLGGVVTAFYSSDLISDGRRGIFLASALAVPAVYLLIRLLRTNRSKRSSYLTADINGKYIKALCLVDSGNLLRDPFSGRPVVLISSEIAKKCFTGEELNFFSNDLAVPPESLEKRVSLIPTETVNGSGLLRAVRPDRMTVDGVEKDALIAVAENSRGSFGSFDGVVPASII